ncbi:IS110 family transposase [Sinorhizobium medicae]|nr:IS110 family transposase [Sinorhizobium medicae]
MTVVTTIGLDTAKQVFQLHGVSSEGAPIFRRGLRRSDVLKFFQKIPSCVVGLEACGGAHYWAREITALGHEVRLIPPAYVKPYVKRGKNDAVNADAIWEAVSRPTMPFVPIRTAAHQASSMLLKARDLLVRQRTQTINALRGHLGELGIVVPRGVDKVDDLISIVRDDDDVRLPPLARIALLPLADRIEACTAETIKLEKHIMRETSQAGRFRQIALRILHLFNELGGVSGALGDDQPVFGQMAPQGVDRLCALPHQEIASRKHDRARRLFLTFHGDKAHRRPLGGLADRLGVGGIVLLTFHEPLDIGWRNQAGRVAELADLTRPIVRTGAGLHGHQAGRLLSEKRQHLVASQLLAETKAP